VFKSAANEKTEVELETSVAQPPKAPAPRTARTGSPANNAKGNPANNAQDNKKGDSGDLAKRIEDRRRQMREDAEKLRNQNGKGPPPKPEPTPKK
jgi:general secretion pathway protein N